VLVEHPDEAAGLAIASGLRFAGYAVSICPGPAGHHQCALLGPEGCAPAHDADLVVCGPGYDRESAREILRELRTRYSKVPLLVETPGEIDEELSELLDGCAQLTAPASPEQIVARVQSLIGHPSEQGSSGA
jgi:DNA-binding response OmpR family regulator